jgi:hypothetical protein
MPHFLKDLKTIFCDHHFFSWRRPKLPLCCPIAMFLCALNDGTLECNGIAMSAFRVIHGLVYCKAVELEELKLTSPTHEHVLNMRA